MCNMTAKILNDRSNTPLKERGEPTSTTTSSSTLTAAAKKRESRRRSLLERIERKGGLDETRRRLSAAVEIIPPPNSASGERATTRGRGPRDVAPHNNLHASMSQLPSSSNTSNTRDALGRSGHSSMSQLEKIKLRKQRQVKRTSMHDSMRSSVSNKRERRRNSVAAVSPERHTPATLDNKHRRTTSPTKTTTSTASSSKRLSKSTKAAIPEQAFEADFEANFKEQHLLVTPESNSEATATRQASRRSLATSRQASRRSVLSSSIDDSLSPPQTQRPRVGRRSRMSESEPAYTNSARRQKERDRSLSSSERQRRRSKSRERLRERRRSQSRDRKQSKTPRFPINEPRSLHASYNVHETLPRRSSHSTKRKPSPGRRLSDPTERVAAMSTTSTTASPTASTPRMENKLRRSSSKDRLSRSSGHSKDRLAKKRDSSLTRSSQHSKDRIKPKRDSSLGRNSGSGRKQHSNVLIKKTSGHTTTTTNSNTSTTPKTSPTGSSKSKSNSNSTTPLRGSVSRSREQAHKLLHASMSQLPTSAADNLEAFSALQNITTAQDAAKVLHASFQYFESKDLFPTDCFEVDTSTICTDDALHNGKSSLLKSKPNNDSTLSEKVKELLKSPETRNKKQRSNTIFASPVPFYKTTGNCTSESEAESEAEEEEEEPQPGVPTPFKSSYEDDVANYQDVQDTNHAAKIYEEVQDEFDFENLDDDSLEFACDVIDTSMDVEIDESDTLSLDSNGFGVKKPTSSSDLSESVRNMFHTNSQDSSNDDLTSSIRILFGGNSRDSSTSRHSSSKHTNGTSATPEDDASYWKMDQDEDLSIIRETKQNQQQQQQQVIDFREVPQEYMDLFAESKKRETSMSDLTKFSGKTNQTAATASTTKESIGELGPAPSSSSSRASHHRTREAVFAFLNDDSNQSMPELIKTAVLEESPKSSKNYSRRHRGSMDHSSKSSGLDISSSSKSNSRRSLDKSSRRKSMLESERVLEGVVEARAEVERLKKIKLEKKERSRRRLLDGSSKRRSSSRRGEDEPMKDASTSSRKSRSMMEDGSTSTRRARILVDEEEEDEGVHPFALTSERNSKSTRKSRRSEDGERVPRKSRTEKSVSSIKTSKSKDSIRTKDSSIKTKESSKSSKTKESSKTKDSTSSSSKLRRPKSDPDVVPSSSSTKKTRSRSKDKARRRTSKYPINITRSP